MISPLGAECEFTSPHRLKSGRSFRISAKSAKLGTMSDPRLQAAARTAIVNATTNTALAILKIIFGIVGHSQALIADGIHSFSDLLSDSLVYVATRMGGGNPDKEHPYGHRRIETIGAIIISLLLVIVACGIVYDTAIKIIHHTTVEKPTWPTIVVAIISIIANEGLFRYTLLEGDKVNSDLIRANAWHNRSDVLSSVIVFFAVGGAMLGIPHLDALGAFAIAILIFKMGMGLVWRSTQELIDASVDEKTLNEITSFIAKIPGVLSVHQLRTRMHGNNIFIDAHIQVASFISVSEGHHISEQVHIQLRKRFVNITDVTVHIDPEDDETIIPSRELPTRETLEKMIKESCHKLPFYSEIKHVHLHYLNGKIVIEIILPLTLLEKYSAEHLNTEFKKSIISPQIKEIKILYE